MALLVARVAVSTTVDLLKVTRCREGCDPTILTCMFDKRLASDAKISHPMRVAGGHFR